MPALVAEGAGGVKGLTAAPVHGDAAPRPGRRGARTRVAAVYEMREAAAAAEPQWLERAGPALERLFDGGVAGTGGYKKGRHGRPHLGFDECGLAVVLSHNCPNNTLPIVWQESEGEGKDGAPRALFPRRERLAGGGG